jgi:hypothetical protein
MAVQHAFQVYDDSDFGDQNVPVEVADEGATSGCHSGGGVNNGPATMDFEDTTSDAQSRAQAILEDSAITPLFADSQLSCLSATLLLLNCLRVHGASNALVNELFMLLSKSVLPTVNSLPTSEYSASKMLRHLGLAFELIHSCADGCMLFKGVGSKLLDRCTKCQKPRYKRVGKLMVPVKVLWYFPFIPRLQRMFSTPVMAGLQTWHKLGRSTDGMIRHVVDSV